MVLLHERFFRDKLKNPLTRPQCNSDINNVGLTDQRAASQGSKHPLLTSKPLSDITGQRSSHLPFSIPFPSLTSHSFFPLRRFLRHPVLSILCGLCIFVSSDVRQMHRAASNACFEHALSALQLTSGCPLRLVFHYYFILRTGASREVMRTGQSTSMKGLKSHFPHGPS